ncbi:RsmB/NOP family class I SAM-dependent RNA methyltransferase [Robiginitalea sp. SC105]|uniref:RsmB/NOP family class I SAM-dependent RNA methyltransferase n=1 Tax=Robiginitalea sp. SC105 TaxID=2762332 RepID=UPI00163977F6|nr:methyltransferase domain-containing protein [Robiginitalea sp. SC105]MBC2839426.1 methyltransferase domain-containing protein [Robiginitalea sp. SC105]
MRMHRNLVIAVWDGLDQIFNEGTYADKAVEQLLRRDKRWGSRDRGFIAETIYEMVRYRRLYAEIAEVAAPFKRQDLQRMFAVWAVLRGHPLPDWKEFNQTPERRIKGRFDALQGTRAIRESVPDWLDTLGSESLGSEKWELELKALNEQAEVVLRVNRLKTTPGQVRESLSGEGFETDAVPGYPDALKLRERANVFRSQAFQSGWFEIQDASSQLVGPLLGAEPGMRVIDACAGAGGKSLHLAALMQNKGQLLAMDIHSNKLRELKKRARRAGAFNIETRPIESSKTFKRLAGSADRVLIDAPCTGLGVLRRNPDAKWKLRPEFIPEVVATQQQLLQDCSRLLKPGGKLVYATCSILPQENQQQVARFLESEAGQGFGLEKELPVSAHESGFDGFYIALLGKQG